SDNAAFRTAVARQVVKEDWRGTIGETRFNDQGDITNRAFTIYRATGGNWVGVETVSPKTGAAAG
ncbi:MAG TPA: hypothetical protein VMU20_11805, partial [Candidatus Dormibacteraeota bacterium]|nr:hypothetical protein [Candidatus Dormibacteraeota bacterium]